MIIFTPKDYQRQVFDSVEYKGANNWATAEDDRVIGGLSEALSGITMHDRSRFERQP